MSQVCSQCLNLDFTNKEKYCSKDRYWCKKRHEYREPGEIICPYDFIYNPNCNKAPKDGYTPSGCYITTIVCNVLGYSDDCELLTTLRNFRDNFLKLNINYLPLLLEYDIVGPKISEEIINIPDNYNFCLNLMKNFLLPCASYINNNNFDVAINTYQNMVLYLMKKFGITHPIITTIPDNYDLNNIGKGRIRKPINES